MTDISHGHSFKLQASNNFWRYSQEALNADEMDRIEWTMIHSKALSAGVESPVMLCSNPQVMPQRTQEASFVIATFARMSADWRPENTRVGPEDGQSLANKTTTSNPLLISL